VKESEEQLCLVRKVVGSVKTDGFVMLGVAAAEPSR
jgi:hypothetical protein